MTSICNIISKNDHEFNCEQKNYNSTDVTKIKSLKIIKIFNGSFNLDQELEHGLHKKRVGPERILICKRKFFSQKQ